MKKLISILLIVLLALGIPLTAVATELTNCTVSAGTVTAKAGETVTVPIQISENPGFTNFAIKLDYDRQKLTLVSIETADGEKPYLCGSLVSTNIAWTEENETAYGYVTCASETEVSENGILFTATFQVSESFSGTAAVIPAVEYIRNNTVLFSAFETVSAVEKSGMISKGLQGDLNHDGSVTIVEAAKIVKAYSTGEASEEILQSVDKNGDGQIGIMEAAAIMKNYQGG